MYGVLKEGFVEAPLTGPTGVTDPSIRIVTRELVRPRDRADRGPGGQVYVKGENENLINSGIGLITA